jgi:hypothetical protein
MFKERDTRALKIASMMFAIFFGKERLPNALLLLK